MEQPPSERTDPSQSINPTHRPGQPRVDDMGFEKEIIQEGSGPTPQRGQTVTVHCTGELPW